MSGLGLSREELLGGMPARRASTIVFAIENLTLQLVVRSRRALARYQPAETARDTERQFIDAVGGGREGGARPRIQDLERYAAEWAHMVPDAPEIRAAILHLLATRYLLDRERVPRIRAALAAGSPAVAEAYRRQQGRDIGEAWTIATDWRERLRWWRARVAERLETMPPFWMAFSLTLTETVGGGMLALPIALAGVGVPAALVLLVVFGLISIVTIAALVEAIVRDGRLRYGAGYFGLLVQNRLGRPGGLVVAIVFFLLNGLALLVGMTGVGRVLEDQTGVAAALWVALLFGAIVWVLRRENLNATIASALVVGIAVLLIAGGMTAFGLLNLQPEYLAGPVVPTGDGGGGAGGGASVIALVFGVLLFVFFGHTSAGNAARTVLRRDPTGRSLLWGNVAAMVVAAIIYCLFTVAVLGAVAPERLAAETGTAVTPLAEAAGPLVGVLGVIYVVLALGIGSLYFSLGLFNQAAEHLDGLRRQPWLRFLAAASPVALVFVLMQALFWLGAESFTGPLNLVGALAVPIVGGILPMLLVASARRRGERVPGTSLRWLGGRLVVVLVTGLYLAGVAAHALFIWTDPFERAVAAVTALAMVALVVASMRRRSFAPRTVLELRADEPPGGGLTVSVVADGHIASEERTPDVAGVGPIEVELPADAPAELHVWAHRPTRDGDTQPIPIEVDDGDEASRRITVRPAGAGWLPPA